MFEGENWTEKKYAVAGDILDGYLVSRDLTKLEVHFIEQKVIIFRFSVRLADEHVG